MAGTLGKRTFGPRRQEPKGTAVREQWFSRPKGAGRGGPIAKLTAEALVKDEVANPDATRGNYLFCGVAQQRKLAPMTRHALIRSALVAGIVVSSAVAAAQDPHLQHHSAKKVPAMQTPQSLGAEHRELHEVLARASKEAGELGRLADELENALAPHFKREEEILYPAAVLVGRYVKRTAPEI